MYVPRIHRQEDQKEIFRYIREFGFATLIGRSHNQIVGTHLPLMIEEGESDDFLYGHLAKGNQQSSCFDGSQELLAIFMQSHAYISSSWYDHINVPTWNYVAVHVYGKAVVIDGQELHDSLRRLVDQYEDGLPNRFYLSDMPEDMQKAHFNGLIGFKMKVDRIEAAYKLSQNRKDNDYHNIVDKLEGSENEGDQQIAAHGFELPRLPIVLGRAKGDLVMRCARTITTPVADHGIG